MQTLNVTRVKRDTQQKKLGKSWELSNSFKVYTVHFRLVRAQCSDRIS